MLNPGKRKMLNQFSTVMQLARGSKLTETQKLAATRDNLRVNLIELNLCTVNNPQGSCGDTQAHDCPHSHFSIMSSENCTR